MELSYISGGSVKRGEDSDAVSICFKVNYRYTQEQHVTQKHYIEWKKPEAEKTTLHLMSYI